MVLRKFIGFKNFFARARAYIVARACLLGRQACLLGRQACLLGRQACLPAGRYEKQQKQSVIAIVFAVSLFTAAFAADEDRNFLRGSDNRFHSVRLNHNPADSTRKEMKISGVCSRIKTIASAGALVGSENSTLDLNVKTTRGLFVLEGLRDNNDPKVIFTVLLAAYKNYPTSIPGETNMLPASRYPLAITLSAQVAGTGNMVLRKGDSLTVHTDSQLFTYALPQAVIPSGGILRLYLGTDDQLYVDASLKHPFHAGPCGGKKS